MEQSEARVNKKLHDVSWRKRLAAGIEDLKHRLQYIAATRADWLRQRRGSTFDPPLRVAGTRHLPRFFFSSREVPGICAAWRQRLPEDAAVTAELAERICQHRFDLLGHQDVACGVEIDWHCDHVHNSQAPLRPWYKLRHLRQAPDLTNAGDCRVVWELNRHQHLVTLARAYRLTGNRKFAAELILQWEQWRQHNPYPLGLNWMNTQEIARRCLSWFWTYFLLLNTPELPRGFRAEWLRLLHLSGKHIDRYALQHRTPGAPLLAEGVALFFIGILCPELEPADDWKRQGWQIILEEVARQARGDEVGFEISSCQHVHKADLLLHACILATTNEVLVPAVFEETVEKMLHTLSLLGRAGAVPRLGPDDGGRIFDPRRNRPEHMLDPLATGAILFGRGDFKSLAGGLREETLWLLGEAGIEQFDQLAGHEPQPGSVALATAGLYLSADAKSRQQLVIDARPQNFPALAVSINRDGKALIVDPGNPIQTAGDNGITSRLQNTVLVDWLDPAENTTFSQLASPAGFKVDTWIGGQNFDLFSACYAHGGNEHSWQHRRRVFSLHSRFWLVHDLITGSGTHHLGVFWHLNAEALRQGGGAGVLAEMGDSGSLRIVAAEDHGWSQDIRQGWWSPVYGRKDPINVLQFSTISSLPAEFATLLTPVANTSYSEGRLTVIPDASGLDLVRGYRYLTDGYEHHMFLGRGQPWELAGWSSDAEFLYWGESHDRVNRLFLCCKATKVERQGRRVVSSGRPLERCEMVMAGEQMDVFSTDPEAQVSKRALDGPIAEISPEPVEEIPPKRRLKKAAGQ
jgi:hypothetical protein